MNLEDIYFHCTTKPYVQEDYPFDKSTLVFKIGGKIFLLIDSDNPISINVKCNPERSIELREQYEGITPGFHMNKKHWITIKLLSDIPKTIIIDCINESYDLVYYSLPKKLQNLLIF
jgi:predicted DNA-binding protein (MmcQ/YjbR family)